MELCETAPRTMAFEPWLGTLPTFSAHQAYFEMSPEGLRWHPKQLANWNRNDLFLLVEVLHQYAQHRSY